MPETEATPTDPDLKVDEPGGTVPPDGGVEQAEQAAAANEPGPPSEDEAEAKLGEATERDTLVEDVLAGVPEGDTVDVEAIAKAAVDAVGGGDDDTVEEVAKGLRTLGFRNDRVIVARAAVDAAKRVTGQ